MLGAVDSMLEREQDEDEPLPVLASWRSAILQRLDANKKLSGMPFEQAIKLFEERQILPKEQFDQLRDAAKRKAFTVAGLAAEELLQEAHGEIARQIRDSREKSYYDEATGKWVYKGPNLREFDKFAKDRLEKAGWTPANPSHVETVFRTNVMSAYSSGRVVEMTQPAVVTARPYWQIVGVNDSRQRETHRKAHGTILSVDHPFWRRAYPPFGYNCRCRVISRSKRWVDAHGGPTRVPEGLPDKGFASGIDASLVPSLNVTTEAQRAPTPANPAHPIERLQPFRPALNPTFPRPPTPSISPPSFVVSPTPPQLPTAPIAPAPLVAPDSREAFAADGMKLTNPETAQHVAEKFLGTTITPKRVRELVAADGALPGSTTTYRVTGAGEEFWINAIISDADGDHVASVVRSYTVNPYGEKVVHHDLMKFSEKYQGSKLGSGMIREQFRQYIALGVARVETEAAWVGQYYWPSIGFRLRDPDDLVGLKAEFKAYMQAVGISAKKAGAAASRAKDLHELAMTRVDGKKLGKEFLLARGESGAPLIELELNLAPDHVDRRLLAKRIGL